MLQPRDYGLWIGEYTDDLLHLYRTTIDEAYRTDSVLDPNGNMLPIISEVGALHFSEKVRTIMDLLLTVHNLESQLLEYELRELNPHPTPTFWNGPWPWIIGFTLLPAAIITTCIGVFS